MWSEFVKKSRAVLASGEQLGALNVKWDQISQMMAYRWPAAIVQNYQHSFVIVEVETGSGS